MVDSKLRDVIVIFKTIRVVFIFVKKLREVSEFTKKHTHHNDHSSPAQIYKCWETRYFGGN